jgi:hypothetical protein
VRCVGVCGVCGVCGGVGCVRCVGVCGVWEICKDWRWKLGMARVGLHVLRG